MSRLFYKKEYAIATPGNLQTGGGNPSALIKTLINGEPGAKQAWTIPIPATPLANTIYGFSIDNIATVSFATSASPTQQSLLDGLFAAYQTNPPANSLGEILKNGTTDLIFTSKQYQIIRTLSSSNNLAPVISTQAEVPKSIPYGVGVTRVSGNRVKRPDGSGQKIIGISLQDVTQERDRVGQYGKNEFPPDRDFPAVARTNGADGVWARVISNNIQEGDPIYCSYFAQTKGYFSNDPTNADDLSAIASFQSEAKIVNDGVIIALVAFNQV